VRAASYMLVIGYQLAPLLDPDGTAYRWLPCQETPLAWDETAPANVRKRAAHICRSECAAIVACARRQAELEDAGYTTSGVWAGHVLTGRGGEHDGPPPITGYPGRRRPTSLPALPADVLHVVG
jgi:hypothetical protein